MKSKTSGAAWPTLHPSMLLPRRQSSRFPFDQANIRYYYLARNAICALANAWKLDGEEVLVPAYCHGVEMRALLHSGVNLRYYPVKAGMQVRLADVVARVTSKTRAIYLIHYLGFPGPVEELGELCKQRDLLLIEDCALALFSTRGTRPLGSFGDAAVFCIYKTLPVPNGGALIVRNGAQPNESAKPPSFVSTISYTASAMARRLPSAGNAGATRRWFSRIRDRVKLAARRMDLVKVGGEQFEPAHATLGMSSICKTVIASQPCGTIIERRRRNFLHLLSRLNGIAETVFPGLPSGVCPLFFPIQTANKLEVQRRLLEAGVDAVNLWWFDAPGVQPGEFPEAEKLRKTVLELPCHQDLAPEAIDWIADQVCRLRASL